MMCWMAATATTPWDAGDGNDSITAGAGNDSILGGAGNDILDGGDNADILDAGDGFDSLIGGGGGPTPFMAGVGNDTLRGGDGADVISGGSWMDFVDYSDSNAAVNVNLTTWAVSGGYAAGDVFSGVDGIIGSNFNDTLVGFDGFGTDPTDTYWNEIYGNAGDDFISGLAGNDSLFGGGRQ